MLRPTLPAPVVLTVPLFTMSSPCMPAISVAPRMIGAAIRKLNRAALSRSRPAIRPAAMDTPDRLMPGIRARAWAMPSPNASGNVMPPMRRDDEHRGDEPCGVGSGPVELLVDDVVEQVADQGRRDGRRDQQPGQLPIRFVAERAIADRGQSGRDEAKPVLAEVQQQGRERAHVEHDAERERCDERVIPAHHVGHQDEVPRRRDRQELGESLDDPHDQGLDDGVHVRTRH